MRLDWFVPALRRHTTREGPSRPSLYHWSRHLLPETLFSDRTTKQRGLVRRWLRRLGMSWLQSPLRRVCQAVCFATFLWLFFYVCWPYTAQPGDSWSGWVPIDVDGEAGRVELRGPGPDDPAFRVGEHLFATDDQDSSPSLGEFEITETGEQRLVLRPLRPLTSEKIEAMSFHSGAWTLHESSPDWPSHYTDDFANKEKFDAEILLAIDPLVSLSTAIATRSWVWSLACAAIILVVCIAIPRGFCGYICPLGTLIDLFTGR